MKKTLWITVGLMAFCGSRQVYAQSKLYPRLFDLQEVTLNDGVFKSAMELNDRLLLEYDVDRLLTPYFRQAGITSWEAQHPNFQNWGSGNFRLDGHVGGHYLTALALAYASSKDEDVRAQMKERMDYMVDKMAECQAMFDSNTDGLYGYIGGLPDNAVWTDLYARNMTRYNNNRGNVPLYTMHKVYAGLRDAYVYGGNEKARECFLKLCDWGVNLISNLTDSELQSVLDTEHGGINEVYADAYRMTGDERYLTAARRYSHQTMVANMQTVNSTFLDNKHANTQVPKYIGFARVAQEDDKSSPSVVASYRNAAHNFWQEVTENRTVALGGNSIAEHFLQASRSSEYITNPDGPESCNTNNMLKLTEDLFADEQKAMYADFYEYATVNHILSTQNPHTGGYVYFTSLRPQHYRMYSQVNQGMWCCVGTGMENHSKYGEFVYAHSPANDTLFVNLFVASRLNSAAFALTQDTRFPYGQQTELTVERDGTYTMAVRRPSWCKEGYRVLVNGAEQTVTAAPGEYVMLKRSWKTGDKVSVDLPMSLELMPCPNYSSYVAFRYGPVLLGAKTGTENLTGQFAGEGRMDHCPSLGTQMSLTSAPMLIGRRENVLDSVYMIDAETLHFKIKKGLYNSERFADLVLQPFFTIHEARYMMYWNQMTSEEWESIKGTVMAEESVVQKLNDRTLDFVSTGEQQSDAGHVLLGEFGKGSYSGEFYVDAQRGKWFSYMLATGGVSENVSLMCRYHSADAGRVSTIYINGKKLCDVKLESRTSTGFYNVEYPVPAELLLDEKGALSDSILVRFEASGTTPAPGLYYLRLLKDWQPLPAYTFTAAQWIIGDAARVDKVEYPEEGNTLKVYGKVGNNNIALQYAACFDETSYLTSDRKYFTVRGSSLKTGSGMAYMWWLNGANHNSSVEPTCQLTLTDGDALLIWDVTKGGLNDNIQSDTVYFSSNGKSMNTVFGLTSSADDGTAVISDISFYAPDELLERYPEAQAALAMNILDENATEQTTVDTYRALLLKKQFAEGEWTGFCVPFNMLRTTARNFFSSFAALEGTVLGEDGVLTLYFKTAARIEEGKLYVVSPLKDMTNITVANAALSAAMPDEVEYDGITVAGTYVALPDAGSDTYVLRDGAFVRCGAGDMVKGLDLYVRLSPECAGKVRKVEYSFDEMPDGIVDVKSEDNAMYDVYGIDGVRMKSSVKQNDTLDNLPKGVYIINGSKRVR